MRVELVERNEQRGVCRSERAGKRRERAPESWAHRWATTTAGSFDGGQVRGARGVEGSDHVEGVPRGVWLTI